MRLRDVTKEHSRESTGLNVKRFCKTSNDSRRLRPVPVSSRLSENPPLAPTTYRILSSVQNHRKSSFTILTEIARHNDTPLGRKISPFRGRGFSISQDVATVQIDQLKRKSHREQILLKLESTKSNAIIQEVDSSLNTGVKTPIVEENTALATTVIPNIDQYKESILESSKKYTSWHKTSTRNQRNSIVDIYKKRKLSKIMETKINLSTSKMENILLNPISEHKQQNKSSPSKLIIDTASPGCHIVADFVLTETTNVIPETLTCDKDSSIQPGICNGGDTISVTSSHNKNNISQKVHHIDADSQIKSDHKQFKIESISPIVDGRILSATSITKAINKMSDTQLNAQSDKISRGGGEIRYGNSLTELTQTLLPSDNEKAAEISLIPRGENDVQTCFIRNDQTGARSLEDEMQNGLRDKNVSNATANFVGVSIIDTHNGNSSTKTTNLWDKSNSQHHTIECKESPSELTERVKRFPTTDDLPKLKMVTSRKGFSIMRMKLCLRNNIYPHTWCNGRANRRIRTKCFSHEHKSCTTCMEIKNIVGNNLRITEWKKFCIPFSCRNKTRSHFKRSSLQLTSGNKWYKKVQFAKFFPGKKLMPQAVTTCDRKTSILSKKKSSTPSVNIEDKAAHIDIGLVEHSSQMKAAIPVLPLCLAWLCLFWNCIIPGSGTILSGCFCLCIGKPRFTEYDSAKLRIGAFIIDLFIGIGQFFTVLFCLVGWGWSIWWGIILVKIAKKNNKYTSKEQTQHSTNRGQDGNTIKRKNPRSVRPHNQARK